MDGIEVFSSIDNPVDFPANDANVYERIIDGVAEISRKAPESAKQKEIQKMITYPDPYDSKVQYIAQNSKNLSIIYKIKKKEMCWGQFTTFRSNVLDIKCMKELLFAAFTDETIAIIDTNTGISADVSIYIPNGIFRMDCINGNVLVVISNNRRCKAWKFFDRHSSTLLFDQVFPLKLPNKFSIQLTQVLNRPNITLIISFNQIDYFYSYNSDAWIAHGIDLPPNFTDAREPQTIFEIEVEMFQKIVDEDPSFLNLLVELIDNYCLTEKDSELLDIMSEIIEIAQLKETYSGVSTKDLFQESMLHIIKNRPLLAQFIKSSKEYKQSIEESTAGAETIKEIKKKIEQEKGIYTPSVVISYKPPFSLKEKIKTAFIEAKNAIEKLNSLKQQLEKESEQNKTQSFPEHTVFPDYNMSKPPKLDTELKSPVLKQKRAEISIPHLKNMRKNMFESDDSVEDDDVVEEIEIKKATTTTSSSSVSPYKSLTESIHTTPEKEESITDINTESDDDPIEEISDTENEPQILSDFRRTIKSPKLPLVQLKSLPVPAKSVPSVPKSSLPRSSAPPEPPNMISPKRNQQNVPTSPRITNQMSILQTPQQTKKITVESESDTADELDILNLAKSDEEKFKVDENLVKNNVPEIRKIKSESDESKSKQDDSDDFVLSLQDEEEEDDDSSSDEISLAQKPHEENIETNDEKQNDIKKQKQNEQENKEKPPENNDIDQQEWGFPILDSSDSDIDKLVDEQLKKASSQSSLPPSEKKYLSSSDESEVEFISETPSRNSSQTAVPIANVPQNHQISSIIKGPTWYRASQVQSKNNSQKSDKNNTKSEVKVTETKNQKQETNKAPQKQDQNRSSEKQDQNKSSQNQEPTRSSQKQEANKIVQNQKRSSQQKEEPKVPQKQVPQDKAPQKQEIPKGPIDVTKQPTDSTDEISSFTLSDSDSDSDQGKGKRNVNKSAPRQDNSLMYQPLSNFMPTFSQAFPTNNNNNSKDKQNRNQNSQDEKSNKESEKEQKSNKEQEKEQKSNKEQEKEEKFNKEVEKEQKSKKVPEKEQKSKKEQEKEEKSNKEQEKEEKENNKKEEEPQTETKPKKYLAKRSKRNPNVNPVVVYVVGQPEEDNKIEEKNTKKSSEEDEKKQMEDAAREQKRKEEEEIQRQKEADKKRKEEENKRFLENQRNLEAWKKNSEKEQKKKQKGEERNSKKEEDKRKKKEAAQKIFEEQKKILDRQKEEEMKKEKAKVEKEKKEKEEDSKKSKEKLSDGQKLVKMDSDSEEHRKAKKLKELNQPIVEVDQKEIIQRKIEIERSKAKNIIHSTMSEFNQKNEKANKLKEDRAKEQRQKEEERKNKSIDSRIDKWNKEIEHVSQENKEKSQKKKESQKQETESKNKQTQKEENPIKPVKKQTARRTPNNKVPPSQVDKVFEGGSQYHEPEKTKNSSQKPSKTPQTKPSPQLKQSPQQTKPSPQLKQSPQQTKPKLQVSKRTPQNVRANFPPMPSSSGEEPYSYDSSSSSSSPETAASSSSSSSSSSDERQPETSNQPKKSLAVRTDPNKAKNNKK